MFILTTKLEFFLTYEPICSKKCSSYYPATFKRKKKVLFDPNCQHDRSTHNIIMHCLLTPKAIGTFSVAEVGFKVEKNTLTKTNKN